MRVVVALGGNALIRRGEAGSIEVQHHNLLGAARALVDLERMGHRLVLTHGNGPQVGFLAIEADAAAATVPPPPLDVLVAESMGQIGYLLAQALTARLAAVGRGRPVTVVLTRTVVDAADPAFAAPSKPVGPVYDEPTARGLADARGWTVARDGTGWRRVVPSPEPLEIVEASSLRALVASGVIVIASGGGGIPVARTGRGALVGVEAVVDKDLAAVLLAEAVGAEALLLLTDVPSVRLGRGTAGEAGIPVLTLAQAAAGVADGTFASGSMGPKVTAAASFVRRTGGFAAIGALEDAVAVLAGRAGTRLVAMDEEARPAAHPVGARTR
ncbi:MAG TPA: carbamate kinase [Candidatus Baltobacteraceae bacterium]|nr:carbamate kinase [Candidatus Baltobacteraceae bacterium]